MLELVIPIVLLCVAAALIIWLMALDEDRIEWGEDE